MTFRAALATFLLLGAARFAHPQSYVISTYAGGPAGQNLAAGMQVAGPVAVDASGNVYFAASIRSGRSIFKLDPNGTMTQVAGSGEVGFSGDGGPAIKAALGFPTGLAVDGAGNLFIVDEAATHYGGFPPAVSGDRVRKVSPNGIITTIAGGGALNGAAADGKPATSALLYYPVGAAVDSAGNLFFSESSDFDGDGNNLVRKVSPDGILTTVAGNGNYGPAGDGGPATSAALLSPGPLAVDGANNLFFTDFYGRMLRKISPDGTISTVVDDKPPDSQFCFCIAGLTADAAGNLLFVESDKQQIRRVSTDGTLATVAADIGPFAWGLGVDSQNDLWITGDSKLRRISGGGLITIVAGSGACCYAGDGGRAAAAQLNHASSVAADAGGTLFIADTGNHRIRKVTPDGIISTAVGSGLWSESCNALAADPAPALEAQLCNPTQVAVDGAGNLLVVDGNRIRRVSPDGVISLVAGTGVAGVNGDGGPAAQAQLAYPNSVAADSAGNIYFAEWARVRRISPDGIITTVAGDGTRPSNGPPPPGDGGPATSVQLWGPAGVTTDGAGNFYFIDGPRIRKVLPDGTITTVAGNGSFTGYHGPTGDGGLATNAPLWAPNGLVSDAAGNLYFSDPVHVRVVTVDGIINTIAGNGEPGYTGDGGPAIRAELWNPVGVAVGPLGNLFVADSFNNVVRVLRPR